ncbi:MAG TPA: phosphoribosylanthranilate isomerase [Pirellulales bacterium]|nr:phosphoribosylanthranilate isomerase [Pirellulales bacterium]
MFQIKICGVTSAADARAVAEAGADCIGLNFYSGSARFLPTSRAEEVLAAIPDGLMKAGVFVNASLSEIQDIAGRLALDFVQLHGDEPPELISQLTGYSVIKAFRLGVEGLGPVTDYLDACYQQAALPAMVLLDAYQPGSYGGTGKTIDWPAAREYHELGAGPALILAGGLKPDNVALAIRAVRPAAVDTASGVESSPGQKDPTRLASFIHAARGGFAEADQRERER